MPRGSVSVLCQTAGGPSCATPDSPVSLPAPPRVALDWARRKTRFRGVERALLSLASVRSAPRLRWIFSACAIALVLPARDALASASPEHPAELLFNLGLGVSRTSDAAGASIRYGVSFTYWLLSAIGLGFEGLGFSNIASLATDNNGCPTQGPCFLADPRNRSGWLFEPRFLVGKTVSIIRFYAALGLGIAHEDVPVSPPRGYFSLEGSLEGGVSVHLSRFSLVPALRLDAMDGAAAALLELSVGVNF